MEIKHLIYKYYETTFAHIEVALQKNTPFQPASTLFLQF